MSLEFLVQAAIAIPAAISIFLLGQHAHRASPKRFANNYNNNRVHFQWLPNQRGYQTGEFIDRAGRPCVIQEGAAGSEPTMWLGRAPHDRMYLSQEHAKMLLPLLQTFAERGTLL